jgi:hypothetical protein
VGETQNRPFQLSFNSALKVGFPRFTGDLGWWLGPGAGVGRTFGLVICLRHTRIAVPAPGSPRLCSTADNPMHFCSQSRNHLPTCVCKCSAIEGVAITGEARDKMRQEWAGRGSDGSENLRVDLIGEPMVEKVRSPSCLFHLIFVAGNRNAFQRSCSTLAFCRSGRRVSRTPYGTRCKMRRSGLGGSTAAG